jgi:hypothetical protein
MIHIYDDATLANALAGDLHSDLRELLATRIAQLGEELAAETEWLVVQPGDTEDDIIRAIGFSPLVEPIDGLRYPEFQQGGWDWILAHDRYFEVQFTFGSTFAYMLLVEDADGVIPDLRELCREHARSVG